jgi:hypothetical protein
MTKEQAKVVTVKAGGKTYFVQLLWGLKMATDVPVYWLHTWPHAPKQKTRALGVRLDEYLVKLDGDSGWAARVTLTGETIVYALDDAQMIAGRTVPRLSIALVTVQLGAQKELALPLQNILTACIKVGTVSGTLHPADDQNPNGYITADLTNTGNFMTPDERNELIGSPQRLPAASIEQQQEALRAAINYKQDLAGDCVGIDFETGAPMTVYRYVTDATGIKDGKTLLQRARKNPELQELAEQSRIRKAKQ